MNVDATNAPNGRFGGPRQTLLSAIGASALLFMFAITPAVASPPAPIWREAFQSSPAAYEPASDDWIDPLVKAFNLPPEMVAAMKSRVVTGTLRSRVTLSARGSQVRVRLSNEAGNSPLHILAGSVGWAAAGFDARSGSLKALTFGGAPSITIPPGAPVLSDPVDLAADSGSQLLVSIDVSDQVRFDIRGGGQLAVAASGQSMREAMDGAALLMGRPLVTGVSVLAVGNPHVIATLGDSITDGNRASPGDALHGWPEQLARRLAGRGHGGAYSVANAGIGGNRLLAGGWGEAGLARLDRDVLRIEGLSHLILLEGTNDIGMSGRSIFGDNPHISADELIAGYRQVIARAHARGVAVVIGTLTPFGGAPSHFSPEKEKLRQAANLWIRTSGEPDQVIDFDKITRDPAAPHQLRQEYDSGDHLHPGEGGYRAMGDGIDLSIFP